MTSVRAKPYMLGPKVDDSSRANAIGSPRVLTEHEIRAIEDARQKVATILRMAWGYSADRAVEAADHAASEASNQFRAGLTLPHVYIHTIFLVFRLADVWLDANAD